MYNYCRRCGRRLKDKRYIILGYGASCYKLIINQQAKELFNIKNEVSKENE